MRRPPPQALQRAGVAAGSDWLVILCNILKMLSFIDSQVCHTARDRAQASWD